MSEPIWIKGHLSIDRKKRNSHFHLSRPHRDATLNRCEEVFANEFWKEWLIKDDWIYEWGDHKDRDSWASKMKLVCTELFVASQQLVDPKVFDGWTDDTEKLGAGRPSQSSWLDPQLVAHTQWARKMSSENGTMGSCLLASGGPPFKSPAFGYLSHGWSDTEVR